MHTTRRWLLATVIVGLLTLAPDASAATCKGAGAVLTKATSTKVRGAIRCLVNQQRVKEGLPKLKASRVLAKIGRSHARDMRDHDFFGHVGSTGLNRKQRFKAAGYRHRGAENLSYDFPTATAIVDAFMASAIHRGNILDRRWSHVGIGTAIKGDKRLYALEFGPAAK